MLSKDIYSLLGLCARARLISRGSVLLDDIRARKVFLVLISQEASENTKKKLKDKCSYYHVDCYVDGSIDDLSHSIGKDNCVAVGILEPGFANKIKSKLGG